MSALLSLLLNPRVVAVLAACALVAFGWSHYTGLRDDLRDARQDAVAARAAADIAIDAAENNAAAAAKADEDRRRVVAALEQAQAEFDAMRDTSRLEEQEIIAAPDDKDGPVSELAHDWQRRRYGAEW